jgi:hypothetical protein
MKTSQRLHLHSEQREPMKISQSHYCWMEEQQLLAEDPDPNQKGWPQSY